MLKFFIFTLYISIKAHAQTVVIIDMPIKRELLTKELSSKVLSINNMSQPENIRADCGEISKSFEQFFTYSLKEQFEKISTLKFINDFEGFAYAIHGYHILDLVVKNSTPKVHFIGVRPPISFKHLKNIQKYIDINLEMEFQFIRKHLKRIRPDIVNISGSETIDDNLFFFESHNVPKEKSALYSKQIYEKWKDFWTKTITLFPNTKFVVSAGNGGRDWIGDEINLKNNQKLTPTPANVDLPNVIVVGSKKKNTLSPFSNYGDLIDVHEDGEEVSAFIPCALRPSLKLTGTSQSTAIYTNKLILNWNRSQLKKSPDKRSSLK